MIEANSIHTDITAFSTVTVLGLAPHGKLTNNSTAVPIYAMSTRYVFTSPASLATIARLTRRLRSTDGHESSRSNRSRNLPGCEGRQGCDPAHGYA